MKTEELHHCSTQISRFQLCFLLSQHDTAPYLVLNKSSEGKVIKQICEELPDIGIAILPQALVIKAISAGFVVHM